MEEKTNPLIVIVGPTASGKSALALSIAERYNGEIICADSRTVYKGMDIGTAKPSLKEQARVPHFLLDVVTPDQPYSAAHFQSSAQEARAEISGRGKLPIMVGGTGLYIDGVIFDFKFLPSVSAAERARLNKMSIDELHTEILEKDLPIPRNENNPRHLMRIIETAGAPQEQSSLRPGTLLIGLEVDQEALDKRIAMRVEAMIENGFLEEAKTLANQYGWDSPGMNAVGYREWQAYFAGTQTLEETKHLIVTHTRQYAKRQRSWFKRNKHIQWISSAEEAMKLVAAQVGQDSER